MNEEVGSFLVKFVTEGLNDVRSDLKDLNKSVDNLNDTFEKTEKKGESFFGALVKWTGLVGGLTAAFRGLKGVVSGVFDAAGNVVDIYQNETLLRTEAKVLEQYGLIAEKNRGSAEDAYGFFQDVDDAMYRYQNSLVTEDEMTRNARVGFSWNYDRRLTEAQNRAAYIDALRQSAQYVYGVQDPKEAKELTGIFSQIVKQKSLRAAMAGSDEQWQNLLAWSDKWRVYTKDEKNLQNAADLMGVQLEFRQTMRGLQMEIMPLLRDVLKALAPHVKKLTDWLATNGEKLAKEITKWINDGKLNELLTDVGNVVKAIWGVAAMLAPIVNWVMKKIGGTVGYGWDLLKVMNPWDPMTSEEFAKKYDVAGKGGLAGDAWRWLRKLDKWTDRPINSKGNTAVSGGGNTVVVQAGEHAKNTVVSPSGAVSHPNKLMGALASSYARY